MTQRRRLTEKSVVPPKAGKDSSIRIAIPSRGLVGLGLAVCFVWALFWLQADRLSAGADNNFRDLYTAARGIDSGKLGGADEGARLPAWTLLVWPLSRLPYPAASLTYQILALWAAVGFIGWWRPPGPSWTLFFAAISAPLFLALWRGNETVFFLLALAWAARQAARGGLFAAGLTLSVCAVQLHLFLLLPVLFAARRGSRMTLGFLTGACVWAAASFAVDPQWPQGLAASFAASAQTLDPRLAPNLNGLLHGVVYAGAIEAAAGVAMAALVWVVARRSSFELALAFCAAASLLVSHCAQPADGLLFLPFSLYVFARGRRLSERTLATLAMIPPPFMAGLAFSMEAFTSLALALLLWTGLETLRATEDETEAAAQPAVNLSLS